MLFLAVTLGFMVENQREHYIEHKRAGVYARSMVSNLQRDTVELKQIVYRGEFAVRFLDSFLHLATTTDIHQIPSGKLYWYGLWGGYLRGFEPNDATFQQMKSSGSLRYFSNYELEQKISEYDQTVRRMRALNGFDHPIFLETRKARARIFDFKYNNEANKIVQSAVYVNYDPARIDSFIRINPPMLSDDRSLFNEYAELCRSRNLRQQQQNARDALDLAVVIIGLLKKEYHLE